MNATRLFRVAVGAFILFVPAVLLAAQKESKDVAAIRQTLESRYPKMKILDVTPAPIPSLYEVFTGGAIYYTDKSGNYLISGSLVDTRSKKDLTEDRVNERNAISFGSLPFDQAIKIVKGSGTRKLAVFTDPDCPYCRRLEEELKTVTDTTVYVFLFPLKQIHPNAEAHAKAIWCSNDRAEAWSQWMLEKKEPQATACAADPVNTVLELGEKLHVSGTPTLYFENGSRSAGAMSAKDLETRLVEAKKAS